MSKLAINGGDPLRREPIQKWPVYDETEVKALIDVLHSGKWWYGDKVAEFERLYAEFPDSTLHVSSDSYLYYLTMARDKGLPVFTIDYAVQPDNVSWIYATSRRHGFIPFTSERALDSLP